jgi:hypothetical protein
MYAVQQPLHWSAVEEVMGLPCLLVGLGRPINANLDQGVADRRAFTLPPDCSSDSQTAAGNCSNQRAI